MSTANLTENAIIICCRYLRSHLDEAQRNMGTSLPVLEMDTTLHKEPEKMRLKIMEEIRRIPSRYDTVLAAMGFCGGSWKNIPSGRRIVLPRLDDCISMLLTTSDVPRPNLKKTGCMYLTDNRDDAMTIPGIREGLIAEYGEKKGRFLFNYWFESYHTVSVIETGAYDSREPGFLAFADLSAELIGGDVEYVPGSNLILQKLVSGNWDDQFHVLEPGRTVSEEDFF